MPIIHVNVWKGFGDERVKTVIQNITKVFVWSSTSKKKYVKRLYNNRKIYNFSPFISSSYFILRSVR